MLKVIERVYEKGINDINEDDFILDRENLFFAVIDGATGVGGLSGKLASTTIKEGLESREIQGSLLDKAIFANRLLGQRALQFAKKETMAEFPKEQRSSCGISAVKLNREKGQFEYIHAGDCMLFVQFLDGTIRTLTFDHVAHLDAAAIAEFVPLIKAKAAEKSHLSILEAKRFLDEERAAIMGQLRKNRMKLNTLNGYGILDGSKEAENFIEYGIISLNRVQKILLLTDGLQLPSSSWEDTAQFAFDHGVEALCKKVDALETTDLLCITYPRFKIADDKTGLLLTL